MRKLSKFSICSFVKNFWQDEEGDVAILFAFLVPVMLSLMVYFENQMQAQYIYTQTQTVLDMATRAGAMTGKAVKSKTTGIKFCTIPYNAKDPDHSGDHVTKKMIQENISTLPKYVQNSITSQMNSGKVEGFNDPDLRAGGYVYIKITFKYKPSTPLFGQSYRFTVESSSKCEVAS